MLGRGLAGCWRDAGLMPVEFCSDAGRMLAGGVAGGTALLLLVGGVREKSRTRCTRGNIHVVCIRTHCTRRAEKKKRVPCRAGRKEDGEEKVERESRVRIITEWRAAWK